MYRKFLFPLLLTSQLAHAAPDTQTGLNAPLRGPLGNIAVNAEQATLLQPEDIARVHEQAKQRGKGFKAALVWHGSSNWVNALSEGAKDTFSQLDIEIVAETDAQYDPAKQAADIENVMALKPDIILSLVIDSTSAATSYRAAVDQGSKLVLLSNPIQGFKPGQDYVGIVTDDMRGMGVAAAEMTRDAIGGNGAIGMIYHDADYFITNNRDQAFRDAIQRGLAGNEQIRIAVERGFTKESETSNIASAMVLQHPELKAIYVAWDAAAEGVIEGLRSMGRGDIKVVTHDLGVNNLVDMAMNGSMYGTIADRPYEIGQAMARLGAYGLIEKPAPAFSVVGFDKVQRDNIRGIWSSAYRTELPRLLDKALK
ncbi:substrate-binding domain-containing protein [uncultured Microbulbifer sp.]|uniref:substrate-binding domain-containing protein n=1 Tax=uncultured Microbulbifer sp. TaxID=348147 RepID=UPI002639CBCD|nr:substrate-binding domain-containing protein [uncultured Microbulbifer sp.]